jgi:hypothetical protein
VWKYRAGKFLAAGRYVLLLYGTLREKLPALFLANSVRVATRSDDGIQGSPPNVEHKRLIKLLLAIECHQLLVRDLSLCATPIISTHAISRKATSRIRFRIIYAQYHDIYLLPPCLCHHPSYAANKRAGGKEAAGQEGQESEEASPPSLKFPPEEAGF